MAVTMGQQLLLLLLLFLTFSVLVANPKKLLYTVANPARGLLNREKSILSGRRTQHLGQQYDVREKDTGKAETEAI